ncbi:unnamed protein product [Symbiodinium pilosum]|uniref:Uncharacterized protein n=1 Tax=Symbiodinium pilosum TaxID=2952 RepID=A0A812MTR3_SYMPI|nr:unnamed protein product [Symbiodinium pilosum]
MPRLLMEPQTAEASHGGLRQSQIEAVWVGPRRVRTQSGVFFGNEILAGPGASAVPHRCSAAFLPELAPSRLRPTSFSEASDAADRAKLIQAEVESARDAAESAEEEAEAAEHAELLVVGLATIFAGLAWFTTFKTWQLYQRWLAMKRRKALCVGAARAAAAQGQLLLVLQYCGNHYHFRYDLAPEELRNTVRDLSPALAEDVELEDGSSSDTLLEEPRSRTSAWRVAGLLATLVFVAVVLVSLPASIGPLKARMTGVMSKSSDWIMTGTFTPMSLPASVATPSAIAPKADLNDGNPCNDDEEKFEGVCYKKCSILTDGTHNIRTTAFTCCAAEKIEDCGFNNQEMKMSICDGFDVSGDINGQEGACPHKTGNCYANEELFLGQCYKKCSDLTDGEYHNRISSFSCCKKDSYLECNPFAFVDSQVKSNPTFNVGGQANSPPHFPIKELDEAR